MFTGNSCFLECSLETCAIVEVLELRHGHFVPHMYKSKMEKGGAKPSATDVCNSLV